MCLQLIISIFLLLPQLLSAALHAKPGCQDRCGDLVIPYPFGVGPNCSHSSYFVINCNSSTDPPKAYLSINKIKKQVIEFNQTYIRLKNPYMISACYDDLSTDNQHILTMNLSGTPYMLSDVNVLTAIGSDDMVLQSKGSSVLSGCSTFCADKNDTGFGDCHFNGCCHQYIYGTTFLEAELIDLSRKSQREKLFPCSYAFIQESTERNETVFSYPLYYLSNSTALVNDDWASASRPPVVRLDWNVGADNCSRAKNSNTYACLDEKSVCVDNGNSYYSEVGYTCSCVEGYEGNPYLPGGCQTISFSSSIAKPGCMDQCGIFSIPFPFGVGPNCYLEPSFEVVCNTDTNPKKPYIRLLNTEIVELNSSKIIVNYMNLSSNCYNRSGSQVGRSLTIDLLKTPYSLSDDNWITAIGCNVMLNGVIGEDKRTSIQSSCTAICSDSLLIYDDGTTLARCIYDPTSYAGDGCCLVPIPRGTTYLESNLTHLSELPTSANIYCSYAFTKYIEKMSENVRYEAGFLLAYNSKMIPLLSAQPIASMALDWRIGRMNCKEARQDITNFVCRNNSDCVDFDATLGGYLCNCSKGYTGNPYLNPGCQDIDECADNATDTCVSNSICQNGPGTFRCSCPKGYIGDGKKDGTGCIPQPPSKTKMIILIGIGSGLGFLLLVSVFFCGVNVESEDVRSFEDMSAMISGTEYTWTNSYKNASASSSETHPLVLFDSAS
ncbi:hypothetical protein SASPL_151743 [Salvia splendens]|uniref:EGF-like domain-containing protein n=1 Tax=Salvia splendens TaxID=180675 RepID=A0A8X8YZD2_SALSN|nr:hypothetical protein SASPL_151743 [Salvia splendens]